MNGTYYRTREASEILGVHPNTLRRWANEGNIEFKRTPGNQRCYKVDTSINESKRRNPEDIIYARVSSRKQLDDLERQKQMLLARFEHASVIQDIGSGLNFKRPGLLRLLEKCFKGEVKTVVVASKDRLCRFGFELLSWIFIKYSVKLVVQDQIDKSPEQEFTEDILAILQVFSCRWNGKRRYRLNAGKKDQITINILPKEDSKSVV